MPLKDTDYQVFYYPTNSDVGKYVKGFSSLDAASNWVRAERIHDIDPGVTIDAHVNGRIEDTFSVDANGLPHREEV